MAISEKTASVILCTKGRYECLDECLNSILTSLSIVSKLGKINEYRYFRHRQIIKRTKTRFGKNRGV